MPIFLKANKINNTIIRANKAITFVKKHLKWHNQIVV